MDDQLHDSVERSLGPNFRVTRELGGGGMSRVFLVEDKKLARSIVVKVLHPDLPGAMNVDRFRREIQVAARLQHPHIVPLLSAGEAEGLPFFSMPFVQGESLRTRLSREGELPIPDVVHILRDVALALAHAHSNGVVHRDIKPENILISGGTAVVTDFGVARALDSAFIRGTLHTTLGVVLGTPVYMSPEQAAGDPHVDHRTDIYAFGVLGYELLTGAHPFSGRSSQAIMAAHATEAPEPITKRRQGISPVLTGLLERCLAKRPSDRPQSVNQILAVLDSLPTHSGESAPNKSGAARRGLTLTGLALAVLTAAALMLFMRNRSSSAGDTPRSVAVLPFVNIGGDQRDEYFSDGMTDEITGALTRVKGIRVASRSSAFAFKNQRDVNFREVAKKLNVGALLEGTVRRSGNRLKVSATLTNASDGLALWAESYERDSKDVFRVQDDIARSIASALQVTLTPATTARLTSRATTNLEAHDLYLRGRFAWNQRTEVQMKQAITYFQQAVALDSAFAQAYAGLADTYLLLPNVSTYSLSKACAKTGEAASRALKLDSTLAEAQTTLARGKAVCIGEWDAAEDGFKRAISLDPQYATAHQWYGDYLANRGRLEESLNEMQIARKLDPLSLQINAEAGRSLYLLRRYDESVADLRRTLDMSPFFSTTNAYLGWNYLQKGMFDSAITKAKLNAQLRKGMGASLGHLAQAYALAGRRQEAEAQVAEMKRRHADGGQMDFSLALAFIGLGQVDEALFWLERAVESHDPDLFENTFDPTLDPLRSHPRFVALWRRMELPPVSPDWH